MISSKRNPLVKRLKRLACKDGRQESSLLLLEGTHLLQEVLRTSFMPKEIIATRAWLIGHTNLLSDLHKSIPIHEVTPSVLQAALSTVNPDGVATIFSLHSLPKNNESANFILALDRLQDPGNLGNLLRTALAADVESVWIASGADPLGQKVLRASAGAILHLPYQRFGSSEREAIKLMEAKLKLAVSQGKQVLATFAPGVSVKREIVPYWEVDWTNPTVLVLGNEGSGLHPSLEACCTHGITLPHSKVVESLNVAASAVPLLLERRRVKMTTDIQNHR